MAVFEIWASQVFFSRSKVAGCSSYFFEPYTSQNSRLRGFKIDRQHLKIEYKATSFSPGTQKKRVQNGE